MAGGIGSVRYDEEFTTGSGGLRLFTCRWVPEKRDPKSVILLCHGYGMECSISMRITGIRLAKAGFAVYGIDYRGHGKSAGLQGYIPNFDELVNDCAKYYTSVCELPQNKNKMRFLLGESMGGAVVLLLHRKKPSFWHGAVLVAPMCKIRQNPLCYKGKPRLQTAKELLMVSLDIEKNLNHVSLPFLVIHGGGDTVTDPSVSQALYETAVSEDKTFKLYPGMWHALTSAEPQQNLHLVFADILSWLDERSATLSDNRSARPSKYVKNDAHYA